MNRVGEDEGENEDEVVEGFGREDRIHVGQADEHRESLGGINLCPSCTALNRPGCRRVGGRLGVDESGKFLVVLRA